MKKVLFFLALIAVVATVNAQVSSTALDFSVRSIYHEYTGVAGDTAVSGTDAAVDFFVPEMGLKLYRVEVELDEISGSANGIAILQGSLNGNDFFEIDTLANTEGTEAQSADATVYLQDVSTGVLYRYFRVLANVSTTGKWDINYIRVYMVGKNED